MDSGNGRAGVRSVSEHFVGTDRVIRQTLLIFSLMTIFGAVFLVAPVLPPTEHNPQSRFLT